MDTLQKQNQKKNKTTHVQDKTCLHPCVALELECQKCHSAMKTKHAPHPHWWIQWLRKVIIFIFPIFLSIHVSDTNQKMRKLLQNL